MKKTAGLSLAALVVSCSLITALWADELVMRDNFFTADEERHQWVNEQNGRTGMLIVSGALLSSPCTLETNEVALPLQKQVEGMQEHYVLTLNLVGCGDGGAVTSAPAQARRDSTMVVQNTLLAGGDGGALQPGQRSVSTGRAVLHGGVNRLTYYLSEVQQQALTGWPSPDRAQGKPYLNPRDHSAHLRLRLDYE
ncbi:nuclease PIN [Buttiauxella sp. B2]|uniref:pilus-assembly fibrillin subunit n=1 Tax=Buttiauxella sp. B2 TaxID=2587812 RepID=UPI001124378C|nr:pilus-assembly fibrillin subunit [Buttiauxella sp. B2]TNV16822.1 nuclease PIN [Buttiauxella sp. B2]